jgi:hypothetical protein
MNSLSFYQAFLLAFILWVVVFGWSVIAMIALRNHILKTKKRTFIHRHHGKVRRINPDALFHSIVCMLKDYEGRYRIGNTLYELSESDGFLALEKHTDHTYDIIAALQVETGHVTYLVDEPLSYLKQVHYSLIAKRKPEPVI